MFSIYWPYYILYYVGGFRQPLCSCIHVVLHIIKVHSSSIQKPCAIRLKFARWNPLPLPFVHKLKSIYCLLMYLWIKISQIKMKIPPTAPTPTMKKAENVFNKWNYLASISLKIYVIQCFFIWNRRCRIFINSPIPTCSSWSTFFGGSSHSQYSNGTS